MSLIYYYHPTSQPSRAIQAFMHLTDIKYEKHIVDIFNCDHRTPEFAKINPLNMIPAIDDNGWKMGESEAIIKYLMNSRKVGQEYYPSDPKVRALVDRYLPYHHSMFRPAIAKYFVVTYKYLKPYSHNTESLDEVRPNVEATCKKFEEVFIKDQKYIAGDVFTIADLLAVNELTQLYYATDFDFNKVPVTKAYIERCLENPVLLEVQSAIKEFPQKVKEIAAKL